MESCNGMKKHISLTVWTLITHSLVMFAGGHSVGNILLLEIGFISGLIGMEDGFLERINWLFIVVASVIGQILVISTFIPMKSLMFKTFQLRSYN